MIIYYLCNNQERRFVPMRKVDKNLFLSFLVILLNCLNIAIKEFQELLKRQRGKVE